MNIELNGNPGQIELVRAMGSKNSVVSAEAMEAFAALITDVIFQVIQQAATRALIYKDLVFDEDDYPSIMLDLFYNEDVNYVTTWSQQIAGGLPTSQVEGVKEMKIATYRLDSAVSWLKKVARKGRLDIVSAAISKMTQELLVKQEYNAWLVVLKALGEAVTKGLKHTVAGGSAGVFQPDDLNQLIIRGRRISASWASGTPDPNPGFGCTNLFVSPEVLGDIRAFAYNPVNTIGSQSTGPVPLPMDVRSQIYKSAGTNEIFGVSITDLIELGANAKYNVLFSSFATNGIAPGGGNFSSSGNELLVGIDATKQSFRRAVARNSETGGTLVVQADNQWSAREDKAGVWAYVEEGICCIDSRGVFGVVI